MSTVPPFPCPGNTAPPGPPTPEEPASLVQLERLLWGFEGLADLLDPDRALDGTERGNVSHLVLLLSERLERLLHALRTERVGLLTALHEARAPQAPDAEEPRL